MVTPSGLVVLTDRRSAAGPLATVVARAVEGGAGWVVLRERDLGYAERRALADDLRALLPPGRLIVAGPDPLGGDAVHLAAADLLPTPGFRLAPRDPQPPNGIRLVGRSCHSLSEIRRLSTEDYVTLSPVYSTASKPGYGPALTPSAAGRLGGGLRWLALGGVTTAAQVRECLAAGAEGVAVMGAIMTARDPAAVAAELSAAAASAPASAAPASVPAASLSASPAAAVPLAAASSSGSGERYVGADQRAGLPLGEGR
ncbi:thiamine phosphate synthase [Actinoplanes sp. NPDC051470]|uniref:thiamine phosphate synthase n=1 Tax=Actinoplanes sp. NPDC051470 TaxID=3157224 RepID=UPI003425EF1D